MKLLNRNWSIERPTLKIFEPKGGKEHTMSNENGLVGGWELVEMQSCPLPEKVATGFSEVTQSMVGAKYVPVLYVGTQVVHGINHMLICKQTVAAQGAPAHLVKMVLNQNTDDDSLVGKWSVVTIEQIV